MSFLKTKSLPIFMWLLPVSFFTYQFILRLWPSLMMQDIMQQFAIDASGFGSLAAAYYYGYSFTQIPLAILFDKYGVRIVLGACSLLTGLATLVFSNTDSLLIATLSRACVGIGSAAGFLAVSKVTSEWFVKSEYARMVGFSFTIGLMGAVYGGKPVSLLIEDLGGMEVAYTLAMVSIAIGIATFVFLRRPSASGLDQIVSSDLLRSPGQVRGKESSFKITDFKALLSSKTIWLLGISNFLMVGSLEGFADVWGVSYLQTAYGLTKGDAAQLCSLIFVGMIFGGPILATFAAKFGNYNVISFAGFTIAILMFMMLLTGFEFNWYLFATLFLIIGVMCCYQVLVFAIGCDLMAPELLSVTIAFLQTMNMIGGSFFHTIIGSIMDRFWTGGMDGLVRVYSLESYEQALMLIPTCAVFGALIVLFIGRKRKS
jgi:sugar phosphate permease